MGSFASFIFLATLADPARRGSAAAGGLLDRSWRHLIPASLSAPAAYPMLRTAFPPGSHFMALLPFLLAAGAVWSGSAFAAGRAWRS